jgi:tRNA pseudouridine synthase 10
MDNLDSIVDSMMSAVHDYEFDTFVVGATLPTQIYEREDAMRARLKIRGRESIKNHLTRDLGIRLLQLTKRRADYMKPDITISLTVDKENHVEVAVKSRPVVLAGRYIKKLRGLPQKQDKCLHCEGKGCDSCNQSGLASYTSVEGIIAKELLTITKGETPKFSWIGSEDQSSLVLGNGRPFSVRIFNPKKRELGNVRIRSSGVSATMSVQEDILEPQARFTVKTRIHAKCASAITKQEMKKLNSLAGSAVSFENRFKTATKRIYSARARQLDSNQFMLTIKADGGMMIKQFVGGEEYMKPNISEILGSKCECVTFDILEVALEQ